MVSQQPKGHFILKANCKVSEISSDVNKKVGKDCTCCSLSLTHSHSINDWPYCQTPTDQQRPIVRGRVRDYGVLESVIQHAIQCELQAYAPESKLILTGHGLEECSDQLLEICFEKFNVPRLAIVPNSVLALYGTGRTDGLIVDVGHGVSSIDAGLNGQIFQPSSQFVKLAGKDLTDSLKDLIVKANNKDGTGHKIMKEFGNIHMWTSTKEKHGRIALHKGGGQALWDARQTIVNRRLSLVYSAKEAAPMIRQMPAIDCRNLFLYLLSYDGKLPSGTEEYPVKLPDGTNLIVRSELTNFSEILFTGTKIKNLAPGSKRMHVSPGRRYSGSILGDFGGFPGESNVMRNPREEGTVWSPRHNNAYNIKSDYMDIPPLQNLFWDSILNTGLSSENRAKLQQNVVLCGGTTLLPQFHERFRNEITLPCGWGSVGAKVYSPLGREHLAWTGGNVLASSSFVDSSLMTTKDEYYETGSKVVEDRLESFYTVNGGS